MARIPSGGVVGSGRTAPAVPVAEARPGEALLRVAGVTVDFGAFRALHDIDLEIGAGQVVAVAGENGAGKSTLVRCLAGDIQPTEGTVWLGGRRLRADPASAAGAGVAVVWQDLALCDNLDVAANLLLGRERRFGMLSSTRFHAAANGLLATLGIPLRDSTLPVSALSGGQRQLVAVARAMRDRPRLLILDEPTASLGVNETRQVEELTARLRGQGTTILLVSHDIDQMFRLADRIIVLRHGRVTGNVDPAESHPDDVLALLSGQLVDSSARRQLSRLNSLAGRLASAEPSSSLSLILSALAAALGTDQLCIHLLEGDRLHTAGALGLAPRAAEGWRELPLGDAGGTVGRAAARGEVVVETDLRWRRPPHGAPLPPEGVRSCWSVPVPGTPALRGVITVFRQAVGRPSRDELDLVSLYGGYVASAVERDRLLQELTNRNRVLETIREVLETLAGPVPLADGMLVALVSLRDGLRADEVGLYVEDDGAVTCRGAVDRWGPATDGGAALEHAARSSLSGVPPPPPRQGTPCDTELPVRFATPAGPAALVARWSDRAAPLDRRALLEDAAHSLRLALEREESERAHQEATALRRSQELHQQFLSRLSHELRTPLTAIHGYASSLMQPDVTWDRASQDRFLSRISAESGRLARLVDDLLDFSAIESGNLRIQSDWCDLSLVLDSARACLPPERSDRIELRAAPGLPVVWADHDRLEQVFVNLMDNAVRHNPPGTHVTVVAAPSGADRVTVSVSDDGVGLPPGVGAFEPRRHTTSTSGSGLGLSIARGIVEAHRGRLELGRARTGTTFVVHLPVEVGDGSTAGQAVDQVVDA